LGRGGRLGLRILALGLNGWLGLNGRLGLGGWGGLRR
jgi:hypothetical protein